MGYTTDCNLLLIYMDQFGIHPSLYPQLRFPCLFRLPPPVSPSLQSLLSAYCNTLPPTTQAPAANPVNPPATTIAFGPLVLFHNAPANIPAMTLFAASCFPLTFPIPAFIAVNPKAITPALFPRNGPRLVTAFRTELRRSFGGAVGGVFLKPSKKPQIPPAVRAVRYVVPVP